MSKEFLRPRRISEKHDKWLAESVITKPVGIEFARNPPFKHRATGVLSWLDSSTTWFTTSNLIQGNIKIPWYPMSFYTRVAHPGFKRRATAVSKRNLIRSTEFDSAVARRLKRTEVTEQRRPRYRRLISQRWRANLHVMATFTKSIWENIQRWYQTSRQGSNYYRKKITKLTSRALALRQSETSKPEVIWPLLTCLTPSFRVSDAAPHFFENGTFQWRKQPTQCLVACITKPNNMVFTWFQYFYSGRFSRKRV